MGIYCLLILVKIPTLCPQQRSVSVIRTMTVVLLFQMSHFFSFPAIQTENDSSNNEAHSFIMSRENFLPECLWIFTMTTCSPQIYNWYYFQYHILAPLHTFAFAKRGFPEDPLPIHFLMKLSTIQIFSSFSSAPWSWVGLVVYRMHKPASDTLRYCVCLQLHFLFLLLWICFQGFRKSWDVNTRLRFYQLVSKFNLTRMVNILILQLHPV